MREIVRVWETCSNTLFAVMQPAGPLVEMCRDMGLIVITAGKGDVVRLVPPLIVSEAEIDQAIATIAEVAKLVLV